MPQNTRITNPFPGLRAFSENEGHLFFGRDSQINDLINKLELSRFLAVVGSSGSGKSSLVRAGLIPWLYDGKLPNTDSNWRIMISRPGNTPVENLADAIINSHTKDSSKKIDLSEKDTIEKKIRSSKEGLSETLLQYFPNKKQFLFIIDQFEEIFRFDKQERQKQHVQRDSVLFISLLLHAVQQDKLKIYVIITMRSEFLGDCTEFIGLPKALNNGQYLIPRMSHKERMETIEGPVMVGNAQMTDELKNRLINDIGFDSDQLPISQHALMRTWNYWETHRIKEEPIDLKHYEAIGTISTALSTHAEEAYSELITDKQRRICRLLFKSFANKDKDSYSIKQTNKLKDICLLTESTEEEVIEVIDIFRKEGRSFLMLSDYTEITPETDIDLSHESLIRIWKRLKHWHTEEKQSAELYIRLASAAAFYQEGKAALWRDPELQTAIQWRKNFAPNEAWALKYDPTFERAMSFLDYSKQQSDFEYKQREKQQRQRLRRARIIAITVGTIGLIAIFATIYALIQKGEADTNAKIAHDMAETAKKNAKIANEMAKAAGLNEDIAKANADTARINENKAKKYALEIQKTYRQLLNSRDKLQQQLTIIEAQQDSLSTQNVQLIAQKKQLDLNIKKIEVLLAKNRRNYLLSISRNLSIIALQLLNEEKTDSATRIALYAYYLNKINNGPVQNASNFAALWACLNTYNIKNNYQPHFHTIHKNSVRAIAVNPATKSIASADDNGDVIIWNPDKILYQLSTGNRIRTLSFSKKDNILAIGLFNGRLLIYKINGAKKAHLLFESEENGIFRNISFSYSDKLQKHYLAVCTDKRIGLFIENDDSFKRIFTKNLKDIGTMEISCNNNLLLVSNNDKVLIYEINTENRDNITIDITNTLEFDKGLRITAIAVNEANTTIAVGNERGTIWITEVNKPDNTLKFTEHVSAITALKFNNKLNQLASASLDNSVRLWNLDNLKEDRLILHHDSWIWDITYNTKTNLLYTVSENKQILEWSVSSRDIAIQLCNKTGKKEITQKQWETITGIDNKNGNNPVPKICN